MHKLGHTRHTSNSVIPGQTKLDHTRTVQTRSYPNSSNSIIPEQIKLGHTRTVQTRSHPTSSNSVTPEQFKLGRTRTVRTRSHPSRSLGRGTAQLGRTSNTIRTLRRRGVISNSGVHHFRQYPAPLVSSRYGSLAAQDCYADEHMAPVTDLQCRAATFPGAFPVGAVWQHAPSGLVTLLVRRGLPAEVAGGALFFQRRRLGPGRRVPGALSIYNRDGTTG